MELKSFSEIFPQENYFASVFYNKKDTFSRVVYGKLNDDAFRFSCDLARSCGMSVHGVNLNGHAVTSVWTKSKNAHTDLVSWLQENARNNQPMFYFLGGYIEAENGALRFHINGTNEPLVYAKKPWSITQSVYRLEPPNVGMGISGGAFSSPDKVFIWDEKMAQIIGKIRAGDVIWH